MARGTAWLFVHGVVCTVGLRGFGDDIRLGLLVALNKRVDHFVNVETLLAGKSGYRREFAERTRVDQDWLLFCFILRLFQNQFFYGNTKGLRKGDKGTGWRVRGLCFIEGDEKTGEPRTVCKCFLSEML